MQIMKAYREILVFICSVLLSVSAVAENVKAVINSTETETLLINDVVLVDPDGDKETTVVNILIKNYMNLA